MSVMNFRTGVDPTISRVAEVLRSDSKEFMVCFANVSCRFHDRNCLEWSLNLIQERRCRVE